EMIGQFALGLAIASPVMICAGLSSLRIVQATDARSDHRFQDYLALRILTTIAGLATVAGILYFTNYPPITASVVLMVAVAKPTWNWRALVAIGTLGLPVLIAAALVSVTTNIPRYFIEHLLGIGQLGTFAAIAYPMAVGITVINAIGQSAMPRLARQYADGKL